MRKHLSRIGSFAVAFGLLFLALQRTAVAGAIAVPEVDPGTAASGIAILSGAVLLLIERFRHR